MKGDLFMTRDKVISKILSVIKIILLFFIIGYFHEYLMSLTQEHINSFVIFISFISLCNTIILIGRKSEERNKKMKSEK